MSNAYRELESLICQLRRMTLQVNGNVEELSITLPHRTWQAVVTSMPPEHWPHVTIPHGQERNSMQVRGVTVYEVDDRRSFR